jgi:hypothetical protein
MPYRNLLFEFLFYKHAEDPGVDARIESSQDDEG